MPSGMKSGVNMSSGNLPESNFAKAVHLTRVIGQDRVPVDALRGVDNQTPAEETTYILRVKPDRRRAKAVYPPHLERRRPRMSSA
jgi:hypothetical protein